MSEPAILVIDDDIDIREAIAEIVARNGYRVLEAADGNEALALLRGGARPVGIILDLMMPGMNGYAFRAAQLADPALADIPVIVMSGGGSVPAAAAQLAAAGYLVKPFELHDVAVALDRLKKA